jgi:lysophospholipase L1-like esterase
MMKALLNHLNQFRNQKGISVSVRLAIIILLSMAFGRVESQVIVDSSSVSELHSRVNQDYPFIDMERNRLDIPNPTSWLQLFHKVKSMTEGNEDQLHIVHIGGSHVQAGILSKRIEQGFKQHFPDKWAGEKGFLFPYQLAGTNSPSGYKIYFTGNWEGCRNAVRTASCNWGVSGINAVTNSPFSTFTIKTENDLKEIEPFCSVKIFCDLESSTLWPEPYTRDCPYEVLINHEAGIIEWRFEEPQDSLELMLVPGNDSTGTFTLQGIQFLSFEPGVVFHPIGVNGASVPSYLRCAGFEAQLSAFPPDLVIFAVGVNDANSPAAEFSVEKFEANYDSLISIFKRVNPDSKFIFFTNNDTYYKKRYPNKNALKVREAMHRLASKYDGAVWDLFGIMGGLGSVNKWHLKGLAKKDKIHFTGAGYNLVGDLFVEAFKESYLQFVDTQTTAVE